LVGACYNPKANVFRRKKMFLASHYLWNYFEKCKVNKEFEVRIVSDCFSSKVETALQNRVVSSYVGAIDSSGCCSQQTPWKLKFFYKMVEYLHIINAHHLVYFKTCPDYS
jgi:hypothetical protein